MVLRQRSLSKIKYKKWKSPRLYGIRFGQFFKEFSPENGDNANFVKDDFDVRNARERCLKPNELPQ